MIHPKPAVFMHIQKTAGTSLIAMASEVYGRNEVISHGEFLKSSIQALSQYRFVSGHFGFAVVKALRRERLAITFLREPRERILSQYYFMRSIQNPSFDIHRMAQKLDLNDFLDLAIAGHPVSATHMFNQQTFQLAHGWCCSGVGAAENMEPSTMLSSALVNLASFDYIGLVESFDEDCRNVFAVLGAPIACVNHSNRGSFRIPLEEMSSRTRDQLDALTELDDVVYRAARDARLRRLATFMGCNDDYRS